MQKHPFRIYKQDNTKSSYKSKSIYINPKSQTIIKPINPINTDAYNTIMNDNNTKGGKEREEMETHLLTPSISSFLVKYLFPVLSTPAIVRLLNNPAILPSTLRIFV